MITIRYNDITKKISLPNGKSLAEALIEAGFFVDTVCGGKGICGKCAVRVTDGIAPISASDADFFTQDELRGGMRLACTLRSVDDITVEPAHCDEASFDIVGSFSSVTAPCQSDAPAEYALAIDIGTTTIAMCIADCASGKIRHSVAQLNHQRQFGADVISRIQAAIGGKGKLLREIIRSDLQSGISALCKESGINVSQISKTAISANTAMTHLLMGYDCRGLSAYPFRPYSTDIITGRACDIIGTRSLSEVTILPSVSAFVGADIVSGLYDCGFGETDDICLLIDLGTNGEMAVGNRNKILVSSVAAGPAFEGGSISCGTPCIDGAICAFNLNGDTPEITTIGKKPPIGVCGTGCIEIVAELLRTGVIDKTGLLSEKYFEKGFPLASKADGTTVYLTQKDIRELQLAKGAVRAGAEILIKRYGIAPQDISHVYIAGGFGYRLDTKKAEYIGMLAHGLGARVTAVGNSSLGGAVKYLLGRASRDDVTRIKSVCRQIDLALDEDFSQSYLNYMLF